MDVLGVRIERRFRQFAEGLLLDGHNHQENVKPKYLGVIHFREKKKLKKNQSENIIARL